jgi:hypothetical protein
MALLRVNLHIAMISSRQEESVWPSCSQLSQPDLLQLIDGAQQSGNQNLALLASATLLCWNQRSTVALPIPSRWPSRRRLMPSQ